MTDEERLERDKQATHVLLGIVCSGLFISAGVKWFDRNLPDLPDRDLRYLLIPVAAVSSAAALIRFVASHAKAPKRDRPMREFLQVKTERPDIREITALESRTRGIRLRLAWFVFGTAALILGCASCATLIGFSGFFSKISAGDSQMNLLTSVLRASSLAFSLAVLYFSAAAFRQFFLSCSAGRSGRTLEESQGAEMSSTR